MKICTLCKISKPDNEFNKKQYRCKWCEKINQCITYWRNKGIELTIEEAIIKIKNNPKNREKKNKPKSKICIKCNILLDLEMFNRHQQKCIDCEINGYEGSKIDSYFEKGYKERISEFIFTEVIPNLNRIKIKKSV